MWDYNLAILLSAVALDWVIGDPRKVPHCVHYVAWQARHLERLFWIQGKGAIATGGCFYLLILLFTLGPASIIQISSRCLWLPLGLFWSVILVFQSIAWRDLVRHTEAVIAPLERGDLKQARARLSWVVGRDTATLDEAEICRAAIETLAESLNDGIIAPLFWALLLGPPGALWFRITNTLDSLVGHRDERWEYFGKVSARMDDLLGYFPGRWSGLLIFLLGRATGFQTCRLDARRHASLNAGYPESAMAHALGVQLGGNNHYAGALHRGPIFHRKGRRPIIADIRRALLIARKTYITSLFLAVLLSVWLQTSGMNLWFLGEPLARLFECHLVAE